MTLVLLSREHGPTERWCALGASNGKYCDDIVSFGTFRRYVLMNFFASYHALLWYTYRTTNSPEALENSIHHRLEFSWGVAESNG
jgi:hypothetical protein